ncbi:Glycoside hydrolase, family 28 [Dillenia turbinata]|uniref:Glycoside hydrolase, family 28 n=1 Tax=Dillenia turbinata TaxID=194707 RepID=A0AAN8UBA8_9MAGN
MRSQKVDSWECLAGLPTPEMQLLLLPLLFEASSSAPVLCLLFLLHLLVELNRDEDATPPKTRCLILYQVALLILIPLSNALEIHNGEYDRWCNYKPKLEPRPHSVSILEFGAVGDGKTLNTVAFQNAIFYLKSFADKGGAQLYVPPGRWLTGSFNLTSHLTLFLERGAVILGTQDLFHWEIVEPLPSYGRGIELPGGRYRSLINGYMLQDVVITGDNGTVDGQGSIWWDWFNSGSLNYSRPSLVEFVSSSDIVVSNLTFLNAPFYNIHPVYCSNVQVLNITVFALPESPYTSGVVPDSSVEVCIEGCSISMGYDAIVFKSGWDEYGIAYSYPTTDVHIREVTLQSFSGSAIAFGSEMSGGISNVLVEHLHIYNSLNGIEFKTTRGRGGYIKEIYILDVELENIHTAFNASGFCGSHPDDNFDPNALPVLNLITIRDVVGTGIASAGSFIGIQESPFTSICLSNISLSLIYGSSTCWACSNVFGFSQSVFPEPCPDLKSSYENSSSACFTLLNPDGKSEDLRLVCVLHCVLVVYEGAVDTIPIWDTLKGQVQAEFADIESDDALSLYPKREKGHLSIDYTCMKWLSLDGKKKRRLGSSFLVLGTGSGDLVALDVSAGQFKWTVSDCHPGGVRAISFPARSSCIYTAGADGMICKIDPMTGNLLGKFKASTKAISSICVSSDGKTIATAAAQLKIFNSSDNKKIKKFSGHAGDVRCMMFTEDGNYILSSAVGERYVAVWRVDADKKQSSSCVLTMEHPPVSLDSLSISGGLVDGGGLHVLAISEIGVCYLWYGKNVEELQHAKPTKVSIKVEGLSTSLKSALPTILAAKLQGTAKPASVNVFAAHGLLIKPAFEKILVSQGVDIYLNSSTDGILLPLNQSQKAKREKHSQHGVTALDRSNAEDSVVPIPKILDFDDKSQRRENSIIASDEATVDDSFSRWSQAKPFETNEDMDVEAVDNVSVSMEDQLRHLGILSNKEDSTAIETLNSTMLKDISVDVNIPPKKIREAVLCMGSSEAYKLLKALVALWKSRTGSGKYILPWISSILVNHSQYVKSQEPVNHMLESLGKLTESKKVAVQSLLRLSGRLQLLTAQVSPFSSTQYFLWFCGFFVSPFDKASVNKTEMLVEDHHMDDNEDEDSEIDEYYYREDDNESQNSSEDDD